MELTGGGALYSLTPESGFGVNKIYDVIAGVDPQSQSRAQKENPPYPPLRKGAVENSLLLERRCRKATEYLQNEILKQVQNDKFSGSFFGEGAKVAFTLAEVLVTMGVIGIVAAMTFPMLARNYNFHIRQQQFKKAYAELSIAVQKTQIDLGEGVRCFYYNKSQQWNECKWFYEELVKNLQIVEKCDDNALSEKCLPKDLKGAEVVYAEVQGGDDKQAAINKFNKTCAGFNTTNIQKKSSVYLLKSGLMLMPYYNPNSYKADGGHYPPLFLVDINGHKAPNKWGHDIFVFEFNKAKQYDSVFRLTASIQCHPIDNGGYYTTTFMEYLYGRSANL